MGNRFSFLVRAQILCQALGAVGMRQDGKGWKGRLSRSGELVRQTRTALWLEGTGGRIRFWETGGRESGIVWALW